MKVIGYTEAGSADVLTEFEVPQPTPGPRDLLVAHVAFAQRALHMSFVR